MLTAPERLLTLAVATVLLAGTASAALVDGQPAVPVVPVAEEAALAAVPDEPAAEEPEPVVEQPPAPEPVAAAPPTDPEPPQEGCPVPRRPGGFGPPPVLDPPVIADDALPAPLPAGPKATDLSAVSGKGIWVTNWPTTSLDVGGLVERTRAAGLQSIWVRTGGTRQGFYGEQVLPQLVPAAHAAGLKVVAWDFPFLSDPVADALRAKQALDLGIDAFAPDVETTYEGTHATAARVELYLSMVRSYAGTRPVAATVPRPTPSRLESFPYSAFEDYADLFVPMVYWSCNEPGALVAESLTELGRWLPVAPVGQAYDMGDEGGRRGLPTREETWRFLDVAHRGGALGASLWTVERMGDGQWEALAEYPWDAPR